MLDGSNIQTLIVASRIQTHCYNMALFADTVVYNGLKVCCVYWSQALLL